MLGVLPKKRNETLTHFPQVWLRHRFTLKFFCFCTSITVAHAKPFDSSVSDAWCSSPGVGWVSGGLWFGSCEFFGREKGGGKIQKKS